jgi:hypothetical protein
MVMNNTRQIVSSVDRLSVSPSRSISKYTKNSLISVTIVITPTTISVGTSSKIKRFICLVFHVVFCPSIPAQDYHASYEA